MKVQFGKYTYFDPTSNDAGSYDLSVAFGGAHLPAGQNMNTYLQQNQQTINRYKQYSFDKDYFNKLIANRQYLDAADYAEKYHFSDPAVQKEHESDIINLRRNGAQLAAIYGRINDDDKLKKIEFASNVFVDGGLEQLQTDNPSDPNYNPYAVEFIKYKNDLGNELESNGWTTSIKPNGRKAKGLRLHFAEGKQTGIFGIDWLAADNENTIEEFYQLSGLTETDLRNAGVKVIHKDGATTLDFNKSNALANRILASIPNHTPLDLPGNGNIPVGIVGYDENGDINNGYRGSFHYLREIVDDANETKIEAFKKLELDTRDYSSTIGPLISDELSALRDQLNAGYISETQYNQQAKAIAPHVFAAINTLGSRNYEMYTNFYNDAATDETLEGANNIQRGELINLISSYAPKDIEVSAMVSNGKIGALITLQASGNESGSDKNDGRRIQIFVPGLLQDEAQAKINRNTSTRAVQELNSMIDWGYDFTTFEGQNLRITGEGKIMLGDEEVSKDTAIREINKSMIMQDASLNLKYQYMNSNGELFDTQGYEQMARLISLNAIQDLYPDMKVNYNPQTQDITLSDNYGNVYNPDNIFNRTLDKNTIQYETYVKLEEVYNMYSKLMNELAYYK